ncbi:Uncharacterized protein BP5553_07242 [Venustampulla echinocandica]|uniref:chitin deacetylase n=1 Tax=Venustampulla echinocandica TaxID=2656787 RepID=A0A370TIX7_9HELO|nr:Uncharacterized protein BP5553_07242 [Venustampulla echinocandica]RDL35311.1 Uncharacterized protein BP5553_07242 [Venustampulla echinocandica]
MAIFVVVAVMSIFLGPFYFIYKPPSFLIRYFQSRWPDVLWHVPTASKTIALTIDDGPSEYTRAIMQVLKANDVNATFFIIGSHVDGHEKVLEDLVRDGNELGNHAMYDEPSKSLTDGVLIEQIETVKEMIHDVYTAVGVDEPTDYFRPGSGFFSQRMRTVLQKLGYRMVLGSIYPHDPQIPFWRINSAHILSMLQPGGIIICHDKRSWTVPMLQKVLPEIKRRGYRVVTVTELLKETRG